MIHELNTTIPTSVECPELKTRGDRIPICYVIASITTPNAGTEGHLLRLLDRIDRERFDPLLVVLQASEWTQQATVNVPTKILGFKSFWQPKDWSIIRRLAGVFRAHRTQIAELYFVEAHFVGALAAKAAAVPVTISCRRDLAYQYGLKERLMARFANRYVTRLLANSEEVVRRIAQVEQVGTDQFDVIYGGLDLEAFDGQLQEPLDDSLTAALADKCVVCLAANLRPIKNVKMFLDCVGIVHRERPSVEFIVLGGGPQEQQLKQYAGRLGVSDVVHWVGSVDSVVPYLRRCAIGCLTSDSEGFSNSIVEYMAAGLPVVSTRVGGIPEAVQEGESGFLVSPGDSATMANRLIELADDVPMRKRFGATARRTVEERFSLRRQMEAYHALYERLLESRHK